MILLSGVLYLVAVVHDVILLVITRSDVRVLGGLVLLLQGAGEEGRARHDLETTDALRVSLPTPHVSSAINVNRKHSSLRSPRQIFKLASGAIACSPA